MLKERTAQEWEELLQAEDVACAVASGAWPDFLLDDWDGRYDQDITTYSYPGLVDCMQQTGMHVDLLETPGKVGVPEPLGASTRAILEELGYGPGQIDALKARNVIVCKED